MRLKNWNPQKAHPIPLLNPCMCQISTPQLNLEGKYVRNTLKKREKLFNEIQFLETLKGAKGLKSLNLPKRHIQSPYYLYYMPNFNPLAQFEGDICEEKNQKIIKTLQKSIFCGCERCNKAEKKTQNTQKAYLELLLNIHVKFYHHSSIWREIWIRQLFF